MKGERRVRLRIVRGDRADLRAMAHLHYAAGMPATAELVLTAWWKELPTPAGVLCVSRPVLNASWREAAWPGLLRVRGVMTAARRQRLQAKRLNRRVRCISRVIVDPRARGLGVASALVRAYLRSPLTSHTEAVAAMGEVCPFFERAGMRVWTLARPRRDADLLERIRAAGMNAADLLSPSRLAPCQRRAMGRALRLWANDSRSTRAKRNRSVDDLALLAAGAAAGVRRVYTFDRS